VSVLAAGALAEFRALPTLAAAFAIVTRHAVALIAQILLILVLTTAVGALIGIGVGIGSSDGSLSRNTNLAIAAAGAIGVVIWLFASVNIWIGIGRVILRGDPLKISGLFRWGRRQWRMIGITILCIVCIFGPAAALAMITTVIGRGNSQIQPALAGITTLASAVWFVLVLARLTLTMPIVADDGPPHALRTSWALTQGYAARLAGGILLITLLMVVIELVAILPAISILHVDSGGIYVNIVQFVVGGFGGALSMAYCTLAYVKLRGSAPA